MRSDNRKKFVRDSTELKQSIKALDQVSINKHLVAKNIDWKFNPPVSPWMGSIWESLVKSVRCCFKVIVKDKLFTAESATFISKVESIINNLLYLWAIATYYTCEQWCKWLQSSDTKSLTRIPANIKCSKKMDLTTSKFPGWRLSRNIHKGPSLFLLANGLYYWSLPQSR